ncbi:hypothetical protein SUGI_0241500 [Cryptomeria japonica]|nr:hypothetical protein SUGI_0241500 [Cryptomeria japonica]
MHKEEFIEQRRIALEKYLRRLATHPVVSKSKEFMLFLQVKGKLPLPTTIDMASRMLDGVAKPPKQSFGAIGGKVDMKSYNGALWLNMEHTLRLHCPEYLAKQPAQEYPELSAVIQIGSYRVVRSL